MSSYDEEPSPPRDEWMGYGYPSPVATHRPDVSPKFRNLDTSAQVPRFRNSADREVAHRQTLYAAKEPERKQQALDRWFALFGVVRKRPPNICQEVT